MTTNLASGPMATNAPTGLRDIVGPVRVSSLAEQLLFWGAVVAILALALALLWWWRRRRTAEAAPAGPPPLPPHERARRRLEAALQLLGDPDRFCTEVSAALRDYLEQRFGWNAPDRTTEEFLAELRDPSSGSKLPTSLSAHSVNETEVASALLHEPLQDFLTRCDFVKFARYEPTETELRELHRAAVRVVEDTLPPPAPLEPRPAVSTPPA